MSRDPMDEWRDQFPTVAGASDPLTPDPFQDAWIASHDTGMHWGCGDPEHSACRVQQLIEANRRAEAEAELLALRSALEPLTTWAERVRRRSAMLRTEPSATSTRELVDMIAAARRALSGQAASCQHPNVVDAKNEVVTSGWWCPDCTRIFATDPRGGRSQGRPGPDPMTTPESILEQWAGCVRRLVAAAPLRAVADETGIDPGPWPTPPQRLAAREEALRVVDAWLERDRVALRAERARWEEAIVMLPDELREAIQRLAADPEEPR